MAAAPTGRGQWSGQLGFVLAAAGSAVGLGNIWRFPYSAGEGGGGAFVLIYLICVVGLGLPVMLVEISLGRATEKNPVGAIKAVDGLNFFIRRGETLGLVGESGCGKSTTGRAMLQLYRPTAGEVWFEGDDLALMKGEQLRRTRRKMQMIWSTQCRFHNNSAWLLEFADDV